MNMPMNILFWASAVAVCVQIVEQSTVGGGFINMMRKRFWRGYNGKIFFWSSAVLLLVYVCGVIVYEILGGAWIIFPLSFAWMFVTNGIWLLVATGIFKEYSPGLITSPIYWVLMYFIMRYNLLQETILTSRFITSAIVGAAITVLLVGSLFVFRRLRAKAA